MSELRDVVSKLAPGADVDEILATECILVEEVHPDIALLMSTNGEAERQVVLKVNGHHIPGMEPVEVLLAMPISFGAQIGVMLNSILIQDVLGGLDADVPEETAPKRTPSPYM